MIFKTLFKNKVGCLIERLKDFPGRKYVLKIKGNVGAKLIKAIKSFFGIRQKMIVCSHWTIEHWRGGNILKIIEEENIVPNAYIDYVLDSSMSGGTPITSWYVAIFNDNYTPIATNTYASPGYTESTDYTESTRPAWQEAGVSSQTITNTANKATFTMGGTDTTIYGVSLVSDNTKGDTAASGAILGPSAQFSSAVTGIINGDVIKIYVTITGSDA